MRGSCVSSSLLSQVLCVCMYVAADAKANALQPPWPCSGIVGVVRALHTPDHVRVLFVRGAHLVRAAACWVLRSALHIFARTPARLHAHVAGAVEDSWKMRTEDHLALAFKAGSSRQSHAFCCISNAAANSLFPFGPSFRRLTQH
jgi:hypothetical protein